MAAYYNEIDPYAAQWLRNLIAAGHIARGDVDERSVIDVRPGDLRGYTQCHFFAGIGLWSLAFRLVGWPDTRPVWSGSCPCQSFSGAAKNRQSFSDERHLWPVWRDLITECRPARVFGEQVASGDGPEWLARVRADMEAAGFAFRATNLPACSVGAPQKGERFWFEAVGSPQSERWRESFEPLPPPESRRPYRGQSTWADARTLGCDGRTRRSVAPAPVVGHGHPNRVARMRAIGNAIVPQVAAAFIEAAHADEP